MISCYALNGYVEPALKLFLGMQVAGVRASGYTFSILVSLVRSVYYGKQLHGRIIRNGVDLSNVVVGNSLIDMYGKVGLVEYAFGVFLTMEELDVISWNSLISGCCKSAYEEVALYQFSVMRATGFSPDEFTVSSVITACSNLQDLEKGKQIFSLCVKLGFLPNTVVSSAIIDLLSKCNRMGDSVQVFEEVNVWDSAVCNAMMSTYVSHGLEEKGLILFVLALRKDVRPTEFTLSCIVSCASFFHPVEQGSQLHSFVVKSGFESDSVVASSLVEMYCKYGLIDYALYIFATMAVRDLISWNTMIMGLAHHGKVVESLDLFKEILRKGPPPDRITLTGVLLACNFGGLVDQGVSIFSSMDKEHGVRPNDDHYACVVEMMTQAGKLKEAADVINAMPNEPSALIWESILVACGVHGNLELTQKIAQKMMELEPHLSLPYLVLSEAYEMRGRWESLVRVRRALKEKSTREVVSCSWIGVKSQMFVFKSCQMLHHGDEDLYSILRLIMQDMEGEDYVC